MPAETVMQAVTLVALVLLLAATVAALPLIQWDLRRTLDRRVQEDAEDAAGRPYDWALDEMLTDDERLELLARETMRR